MSMQSGRVFKGMCILFGAGGLIAVFSLILIARMRAPEEVAIQQHLERKAPEKMQQEAPAIAVQPDAEERPAAESFESPKALPQKPKEASLEEAVAAYEDQMRALEKEIAAYRERHAVFQNFYALSEAVLLPLVYEGQAALCALYEHGWPELEPNESQRQFAQAVLCPMLQEMVEEIRALAEKGALLVDQDTHSRALFEMMRQNGGAESLGEEMLFPEGDESLEALQQRHMLGESAFLLWGLVGEVLTRCNPEIERKKEGLALKRQGLYRLFGEAGPCPLKAEAGDPFCKQLKSFEQEVKAEYQHTRSACRDHCE